jgi:hypothetical protein
MPKLKEQMNDAQTKNEVRIPCSFAMCEAMHVILTHEKIDHECLMGNTVIAYPRDKHQEVSRLIEEWRRAVMSLSYTIVRVPTRNGEPL